jgi:L-ascorbate metabolism protein UlaG (beta-lactamase superfamily)
MALDNGVEITWLGHAAFRIKTPDGAVIFTDPFLSGNPSAPGGAESHERADIILPSHGHGDNLGDTAELARRTGATVLCIYEIAQWLGKQGVENVVGMNIGGTVDVKNVQVTMVQAWHSSSIADGDTLLPGGTACGFVLQLANGYTIYFSGDTGVFLDMQLFGKLFSPDLAILSIGDHFTMGPRGAAEAIRLLGAKNVIPMHYGTFPMLTGTPEKLREETRDIAGLNIYAIAPGETLT